MANFILHFSLGSFLVICFGIWIQLLRIANALEAMRREQ